MLAMPVKATLSLLYILSLRKKTQEVEKEKYLNSGDYSNPG